MEQPHTPPAQPQPPVPPQPPVYAQAPAPGNPGETLGIIGLVLAFFGMSLIGVILSVMSYKKSKEVGMPTTLGVVGIVINTIILVFWVLIIVFYAFVIGMAIASGGDSSSYNSY